MSPLSHALVLLGLDATKYGVREDVVTQHGGGPTLRSARRDTAVGKPWTATMGLQEDATQHQTLDQAFRCAAAMHSKRPAMGTRPILKVCRRHPAALIPDACR